MLSLAPYNSWQHILLGPDGLRMCCPGFVYASGPVPTTTPNLAALRIEPKCIFAPSDVTLYTCESFAPSGGATVRGMMEVTTDEMM